MHRSILNAPLLLETCSVSLGLLQNHMQGWHARWRFLRLPAWPFLDPLDLSSGPPQAGPGFMRKMKLRHAPPALACGHVLPVLPLLTNELQESAEK